MLRQHETACKNWTWRLPDLRPTLELPYTVPLIYSSKFLMPPPPFSERETNDYRVANRQLADMMERSGYITRIEQENQIKITRQSPDEFKIKKCKSPLLLHGVKWQLGSAAKYCKKALRRQFERDFAARHEQNGEEIYSQQVQIHKKKVGWVIGIHGSTVGRIERRCNVVIQSDNSANNRGKFTIQGTWHSIGRAIDEMVRVVQNKPGNRDRIGKAHIQDDNGVVMCLIGVLLQRNGEMLFVHDQRVYQI